MSQRPNKQAEINKYRRRSMIDGALRSLAENGVAGTTVRSICGGSAGSRGLIAHYYESKEDLIAAAFLDLMQTIAATIRRSQKNCGEDPVCQLKALPRVLFSPKVFTKVNRGAFLTFWHEIRFNSTVRKANRDMYREYFKVVENQFERAAKEANLSIDPTCAASGLIAMIDGLWLGLSINNKGISRKDAVGLCCIYIDQQLNNG